MNDPPSGHPYASGRRDSSLQEATVPDEYVLRLEASGEVTPAPLDDETTEPEPEEAEQ